MRETSLHCSRASPRSFSSRELTHRRNSPPPILWRAQLLLCDSKVFLVNNSVQLVSTDRNHQHLSVQLPVQEQFEGLTFFDRVSLRMGVWLVLRTERRRVKEAHERETLLLRHRLQQEAERLQLERERKFAVPGLQRRMF